MSWQQDKASINAWYLSNMGRNMTEEEWVNHWDSVFKYQPPSTIKDIINNLTVATAKTIENNLLKAASAPTPTPNTPGVTGIDKTNKNYQYINTLYKSKLGREISDNEWTKYYEPKQNEVDSWSDLVSNSIEAKTFANKISIGEDSSWVDKQKPSETTPADTANQTTDWIKQLYASMQPQIEAGVKSAASQRGGLDTGGYLTAMGKAKAGTWEQMLQAIIGQSNTDRSFTENQRQFNVTQENLKGSDAEKYATLAAQLQASQPSGWDYVLKGMGAAAPLAAIPGLGGWAMLAGGLAGYGKKQGLF